MDLVQRPDRFNIIGYPGSDLIIPFSLEDGLTGEVSIRIFRGEGAARIELQNPDLKPDVVQASDATTGEIRFYGHQTEQYEGFTHYNRVYLNGTIYGAGTVIFSPVTDNVANTAGPLVLSAGSAQRIVLKPLGSTASSAGAQVAKPFDFRTTPAVNGQRITHNLDADHIVSYAFDAECMISYDNVVVPARLGNDDIDRNAGILFVPEPETGPRRFVGVVYVQGFKLN